MSKKRKIVIIDSDEEEENLVRFHRNVPVEELQTYQTLQDQAGGANEEIVTSRGRTVRAPRRYSPTANNPKPSTSKAKPKSPSPQRDLSESDNESTISERASSPETLREGTPDPNAVDNINLYNNPTKILETEKLKIFIEKTEFQRQKRFKVDDHLYIMKVETKSNQIIFLKDLTEILENCFIEVINEIKQFYNNQNDTNLLYISIYQPNLTSAIKSQGLDIQKSSAESLIQHVMNMFHRFVNSNETLKLQNGFKVYFKVFSYAHFQDLKSRRKTHLKTSLGCTNSQTNFNGCAYLHTCFINFFKHDCLLVSCILVALFHHFLQGSKELYFYFKPLWHKKRQLHPNVIPKVLHDFQDLIFDVKTFLELNPFGPYDSTLIEPMHYLFESQITIIKSLNEEYALIERYPKKFDNSLPQIFLYMEQPNHVVAIINLHKFFNQNKAFCMYCLKTYNCCNYTYNRHTCNLREFHCNHCNFPLANSLTTRKYLHLPMKYCYKNLEENNPLSCKRCKNSFPTQSCFNNHKLLVCKTLKYCNYCKQRFYHFEQHSCEKKFFCKQCFTHTSTRNTHFCKFYQVKPTKAWRKMIFFDFQFFGSSIVPNAVIVRDEISPGEFREIFWGEDDCNIRSQNYCFDYDIYQRKPNVNIPKKKPTKNIKSLMANNAKENNFISKFLNFLLSEENYFSLVLSINDEKNNMGTILKILAFNNLIPKVVKRNNKFISLRLVTNNLLFLNFSNYFSGTIVDLASHCMYKKKLIFFPINLNYHEWCKFEGSIPKIEAFISLLDNPDQVSKKQFFVQHFEGIWSYQKELQKFCNQTIDIISSCILNFIKECLIFQEKTFSSQNAISNYLFPMEDYVWTLPSYSYKLLLFLYGNKEDIYHLSTSKNLNVSKSEHEFCLYMCYKYPHLKFRHNFNHPNGQKRFGNYTVDLYSPISKQVYMFCGCIYHYHSLNVCLDKKRIETASNSDFLKNFKTYEQEKDSQIKFQIFMRKNHPDKFSEIIYVYECEFKYFKENNSDYKTFLDSQLHCVLNRPLERLNLRVPQRQGFLETYSLYAETTEKSQIRMGDINSFYSYLSTICFIPVGKPKILIGLDLNFITMSNNFLFYKDVELKYGFIFCTVLPPKNLPYPFLYYRLKNNESVLTLCRSCAELKKKICKHSDKARAFTSIYTIREFLLSIKLGYVCLSIFELHYFEKAKPILQNYFSTMASMRFLNSCTTSDKETYCNTINASLKLPSEFLLNPINVTNNEMKKNIYKLMLNSCLGKFSSNDNLGQTVIVSSQAQAEEIARKFEILEVEVLTEYSLQILYKKSPNKSQFSGFKNLYIGATITSEARIYLYKKMLKLESLGCTILAADTDSLFYLQPDFVSDFDTLNYGIELGQFKHIYGCANEIIQFYSLGNRNYSVLIKTEKDCFETIIKCKGVCLNTSFNLKKITLDVYKSFIESHFLNELKSIVLYQPVQKKVNLFLDKRTIIQKFTMCNEIFVKRIFYNQNKSLPFGFAK